MLRRFFGTFAMLKECVAMSLSNIRGNRMRSFLTVLGIMIGVTAVIALITTISGVTGSLSSSFTSMGAGTLMVTVTGSDLKSGMTDADLDALAELDEVDGITPSVSLSARVSRGGSYETGISVSGKSAYYFQTNEGVVERGRAINVVDTANTSFVCLISQEMVDTFFYGVDPVGEQIYIDGVPFLVVGLFSDEESEIDREHLLRRRRHPHSLHHGAEDEQRKRRDVVHHLPDRRRGLRGGGRRDRGRDGRHVQL